MYNKSDIKKEIAELAKEIKLLASDCTDMNTLQVSLQLLNEKNILLKYLESLPTEKMQGPIAEKISPDIFPDIKEEAKKETTTDLFGNEISIRESKVLGIKSKDNKSLSEKLQNKKIEDLNTAIGINEKFRFINELFDGNGNEYNVAVNQINNFSSQEEADHYLANLKGVYKWNDESTAVLNFTELVYRRFL